MENRASNPDWNTADKPKSLKAHAEWLHREAVRVFTQDKTHCHILFSDDGLSSVNATA